MSPPNLSFLIAALIGWGSLQAICLAQSPVNDAFDNPTQITGDPTTAPLAASGTTVNASKEATEPNHAGSVGGASIWYEWSAPSSGPVSIDLAGSDFDTLLAVYTGQTLDALRLIIFNDDGDGDIGPNVPGKAVFNAVAGSSYRIAVDGYPIDGVAPTGNVSLSITAATPPPNDAFAYAIDLGDALPATSPPGSQVDSTIEAGEPTHGGLFAFGSTWYTWTAAEGGAVQVRVDNASPRPALVAVYEGDSIGELSLLGTALPGTSALIPTIAGTTYRIAAVGIYINGVQTRGEATVNIARAGARPVEDFGFGQSWQWHHPLDATDPATADADFHSTWYRPSEGYDGPAFNPAAPAPLGYGTIAAAEIETDIGTPVGARYGAYFLREFILGAPIRVPLLEVLADDGAIIYLDGAEVGRVNVTGPDVYTRLADDSSKTETHTSLIPIGPIAAGTHTIGISLHNATTTSSDLGFDLRLLEGIRFTGEIALGGEPLCTGFQDPAAGAGFYAGRSNGNELGWTTNSGSVIAAGATEQAFEVSDATGVQVQTERIDVTGKSALVASFDLRTIDTSSGLEATDSLRVFVEGSYDGLTFRPVADIFARLTGGDPDPFEIYRSEHDYTSFSTEVGDIPDGLVSVRLVAEATADSTSEHLILDNFCLATGVAPIRLLSFSVGPGVGLTLSIESEPGHLYELQASPDLGASGWQFLAGEVANLNQHTFTQTGEPPVGRMYYRVIDLGED